MSHRLPEFLRQPESDRLVQAAASDRDRLILLLGLGAGLRCAEIIRMRIEEVDLADLSVFVGHGKGNKQRYVAIPAFLAEALKEFIGDRRQGWLFPSPRKPDRPLTTRAVRYLAQRLRAEANILRRANPHVWRHSYACNLLRSGADITEICQLLGHSSPAVTAKFYLHCDVSRLKGVVNRLTDPNQNGNEPPKIGGDSDGGNPRTAA